MIQIPMPRRNHKKLRDEILNYFNRYGCLDKETCYTHFGTQALSQWIYIFKKEGMRFRTGKNRKGITKYCIKK